MLLTFDINTAQSCNLDCAYCFEPKVKQKFLSLNQADKIIEFILNVYKQRWFYASGNYEGIMIQFWGGEPTLNTEVIEKFYNKLYRIPTIHFNIFTNGVWNKEFKKFLKDKPRISLQISFDGEPLQSKRRKVNILENIEYASNLVPFTLKATVMLEDIQYMYECYKDTKELIQRLKLNANYEPSLDLYSNDILDSKLLEDQLTKIRNDDILNIRRYFVWRTGRCFPGVRHFGIDIDGSIYPCHSCFYYKDKIKPITSIYLDSCYKDLQKSILEVKYLNEDMKYGIINCPLLTWIKENEN